MERYLIFGEIILLYFQTAFITCISSVPGADREPHCYSRFDYEYKVVQKIVALENKCSELQEANADLRTEIGSLGNKVQGNYRNAKFSCKQHVLIMDLFICFAAPFLNDGEQLYHLLRVYWLVPAGTAV